MVNNDRVLFVQILIVLIVFIFIIRLFYIQIIEDEYKIAAENNIIQKINQYPYRGLVYDNYQDLIVFNSPSYDLMIIPKEVGGIDIEKFCQLFEIEKKEFSNKLKEVKRHSLILSSIFIKGISKTKFAKIQEQLIDFPGFYVLPRTVRLYNTQSMANILGYIGEVSANFLKNDQSNYYNIGDHIGIGGIEQSYEEDIRGKRGTLFKVVNVNGVVQNDYREGEFDTLSEPGKSIYLTIDVDIQQYAEKLMKGKVGSLVAIEPATGKILALVSAPSYDPALLSGNLLSKNFNILASDTNKPLFNRPLQAGYPPGSMFKTLQAIIALHEGVLDEEEIIFHNGQYIGDLAPPGEYNLIKAIQKSSNNYFYLVMKRMVQKGYKQNPYEDSKLGFQRWNDYVKLFGLGQRLGIDLPNEFAGKIPNPEYYDKIYGENRWKYSNISSLSIGQGELLVTPLQMANLAAIIANRGFYVTPHVVSKIEKKTNPSLVKKILPFDTTLFTFIVEGMERVMKHGSGRRGHQEGLFLCGKTSTVQNIHGEDHSGFMGFAPKYSPKIAISAYVENAGQGGRAAVSVASLIVEKYLFGEVKRKWLEEYVLEEKYLKTYEKRHISMEH